MKKIILLPALMTAGFTTTSFAASPTEVTSSSLSANLKQIGKKIDYAGKSAFTQRQTFEKLFTNYLHPTNDANFAQAAMNLFPLTSDETAKNLYEQTHTLNNNLFKYSLANSISWIQPTNGQSLPIDTLICQTRNTSNSAPTTMQRCFMNMLQKTTQAQLSKKDDSHIPNTLLDYLSGYEGESTLRSTGSYLEKIDSKSQNEVEQNLQAGDDLLNPVTALGLNEQLGLNEHSNKTINTDNLLANTSAFGMILTGAWELSSLDHLQVKTGNLNENQQKDIKLYTTKARQLAITNALLMNNVYSLAQDRQASTATYPFASSQDKQLSKGERDDYIGNHRLKVDPKKPNDSWVQKISTENPTQLMRRQTLMMAEALHQREENHKLLKRILATLTVISAENKDAYTKALEAAKQKYSKDGT